jgi:hypothetical protein
MDSIPPVVIVPSNWPMYALQRFEETAQSLATSVRHPVYFAKVADENLKDITGQLNNLPFNHLTLRALKLLKPVTPEAMSAAPFLYLNDGRPNWGAMWEGYCDLALHGGPPHRGADSPLVHPDGFGEASPEFDALAEIQRGIWETTKLHAEAAEPGWIVVSCDSKMMAAWLCATIILENVEARCDGDRLYLPASSEFDLKNEVKSVITVLAKTHHYWQAHVASGTPA